MTSGPESSVGLGVSSQSPVGPIVGISVVGLNESDGLALGVSVGPAVGCYKVRERKLRMSCSSIRKASNVGLVITAYLT